MFALFTDSTIDSNHESKTATAQSLGYRRFKYLHAWQFCSPFHTQTFVYHLFQSHVSSNIHLISGNLQNDLLVLILP
jgi:hypothetical protein